MVDTNNLIKMKKLLLQDLSNNVLHYYIFSKLFKNYSLITNGICAIIEKTLDNSYYIVVFDNPATKIMCKININKQCKYIYLKELSTASINEFQIEFENKNDAKNFSLQIINFINQSKLSFETDIVIPEISQSLPTNISKQIDIIKRKPPPPPPRNSTTKLSTSLPTNINTMPYKEELLTKIKTRTNLYEK